VAANVFGLFDKPRPPLVRQLVAAWSHSALQNDVWSLLRVDFQLPGEGSGDLWVRRHVYRFTIEITMPRPVVTPLGDESLIEDGG